MPLDAEWLGLCARSESDQPHEWQPICWVVRNRVEGRGFSNTYEGVITTPKQFSYFNQYQHLEDEDAMFAAAISGYAGDDTDWPSNDLDKAIGCAMHVIGQPRYRSPFSHRVFHFWSPVSMRPRGSDPTWASDLRVFTLPGIDPQRFKFGES